VAKARPPEFYEKLGKIWHSALYGQIYYDIQKEFNFQYGYEWANKHVSIGKKKYPDYFPKRLKTPKNLSVLMLKNEIDFLKKEIERLKKENNNAN